MLGHFGRKRNLETLGWLPWTSPIGHEIPNDTSFGVADLCCVIDDGIQPLASVGVERDSGHAMNLRRTGS
jgi:hypothetical protein